MTIEEAMERVRAWIAMSGAERNRLAYNVGGPIVDPVRIVLAEVERLRADANVTIRDNCPS